MPWIAATLITYGGIAAPLAWLLLVLLGAYLALFWVAFALLLVLQYRRHPSMLVMLLFALAGLLGTSS